MFEVGCFKIRIMSSITGIMILKSRPGAITLWHCTSHLPLTYYFIIAGVGNCKFTVVHTENNTIIKK